MGLGITMFISKYKKTDEIALTEQQNFKKDICEQNFFDKNKPLVLIVEDDPSIGKLIARIVQRLELMPLVAENGQESLQMLQRNSDNTIALMIVDLFVPKISGKELVERVYKEYPKIKILMMSGYGEDYLHQHGMIDNNTNFIEKPFSLEAITDKIKKILSNNL